MLRSGTGLQSPKSEIIGTVKSELIGSPAGFESDDRLWYVNIMSGETLEFNNIRFAHNSFSFRLDFVMLDAFDDLATPPYSVTAAAQNTWLSARIKETVSPTFSSPCYDSQPYQVRFLACSRALILAGNR